MGYKGGILIANTVKNTYFDKEMNVIKEEIWSDFAPDVTDSFNNNKKIEYISQQQSCNKAEYITSRKMFFAPDFCKWADCSTQEGLETLENIYIDAQITRVNRIYKEGGRK